MSKYLVIIRTNKGNQIAMHKTNDLNDTLRRILRAREQKENKRGKWRTAETDAIIRANYRRVPAVQIAAMISTDELPVTGNMVIGRASRLGLSR